jgi:hypothetical protein
MRLAEGFARHPFQEIAGDRFARCEGEGVHHPVEAPH